MADHITVRLPDDVRLHVAVSGAEDATTTLVLLHGWTLDHRTWHRQIDALDRPPAGAADRGLRRPRARPLQVPPRCGPPPPRLGDDLARGAPTGGPGPGPVVLVGHSMGGMTIMEYAHRHPGRSPTGSPGWSSSPPPPRDTPTPATGSPPGSPG